MSHHQRFKADITDAEQSTINIDKELFVSDLFATLAGNLENVKKYSGDLEKFQGVFTEIYRILADSFHSLPPSENKGQPIHTLSGAKITKRAKILLKAMIHAVKADDHLDEEQQRLLIKEIFIPGIGLTTSTFLAGEVLDMSGYQAIAKIADSQATKAEMYFISRAVIDIDNPKQASFLKNLVKSMELPYDLVCQLENYAMSVFGDARNSFIKKPITNYPKQLS